VISLIAWVASLQIMLDKGKVLDCFSSPVICTPAVIATTGFLLFLIWEFTDLRLFAVGNFRGGAIAIQVAYAVFFRTS
jgi:DHA2 family multidrug resistance protein